MNLYLTSRFLSVILSFLDLQFTNAAPFAFVQQIIIKSAVIPWNKNLILMDAIRAPLQQAFPVIDFLSSTQFSFRYVCNSMVSHFALRYRTKQQGERTIKFISSFCLQVLAHAFLIS
jgi:hypothetical protein